MNRKRIVALGKLGLLFGVPIGLIFGLFSCGVYVGSAQRVAILTFERDWLGLDVAVPAGDDEADKGESDKGEADKGESDKGESDKGESDKGEADKGEADKGEADKGEAAKGEAAKGDADASSAAEPGANAPGKSLGDAAPVRPGDAAATAPGIAPPGTGAEVVARVDPLGAALQARANMPITLHVKVLVDQALIDARTDWIDYVQRTVREASGIYERQFGITVSLASVGRWPVATDGMDATQLLNDLRTRPRESAEVLIGLTERRPDAHVSGKADTPIEDNPTNGAYALVYATPGSSRPHLRTLLHELAHTLGAKDIVDRDSAGWLGKSFMSYAPVRDDEAAWIDPANRERILGRKDLPFAPEPPAPTGGVR